MTDERKRAKALLAAGEMFLIGFGSELEKNGENDVLVDEVYRAVAAFVKGKNYFAITGNRDGKLSDGTFFPALTASPNLEGQEENWKSYLNWLSCTQGRALVTLELGEGFRQPQLMRWPFEKAVLYNKKAALIRVGTMFPQVPKELGEQALSIRMDAASFVKECIAGDSDH